MSIQFFVRRFSLYFILFFSSSSISFAQSEAYVISRIANHWNCQTEVSVKNGRVDLVTYTRAYEVERASKWKHSIGQALWYALQTNKEPGIILIVEDEQDYRYGMMLNSTLQYAGLASKVEVLYYPQDIFKSESFYKAEPVKTAQGRYWITSTGKRHNGTCRYYNNTKTGRFGQANEGVACKICGG